MKVKTFNYTDAKGKQSSRKLLVVTEPVDKVSGVDLSEMSDEVIGEFAERYNQIHDAYMQAMTNLQNEFDLNYRFRQFIPERMADVVSETI